MGNIKTLVEETYKKNGRLKSQAQEIADIASLSCEMAATDIHRGLLTETFYSAGAAVPS